MQPSTDTQLTSRDSARSRTGRVALIRRSLPGLVFLLAFVSLAHAGTQQSPNQYPSPTVKNPAAKGVFEAYEWEKNKLSGGWAGIRSKMAEYGLAIDIQYAAVVMQNTHGGFDSGMVGGGPLGVTATVDTENLLGLKGGTLFFDWEFYNWYNQRYAPGDTFDPTGSYVGANTNFIDSDQSTLNQIAQLYYRQAFLDDQLALTFGKMDANAPFSSIQAAGAFQNSIAMYTSTLNAFIPTYPNESTGLMGEIGNSDSIKLKLGWFDGTSAAYDPSTGTTGPSTGARGPETFFHNDGHWWLVAQMDLAWTLKGELPGNVGLGAWLQTGRVATGGFDQAGVTDVPGWYIQWEQTLWTLNADLAQNGGGLVFFGQFGWSDPDKNPVHWSLMAGLSATGFLSKRPADSIGIMFAYSRFTENPGIYQSTRRDGSPGPTGGAESSLEAYYIAQWSSWSYLQPGLMWIHTPGAGDPAPLKDDVLMYVVVGVDF